MDEVTSTQSAPASSRRPSVRELILSEEEGSCSVNPTRQRAKTERPKLGLCPSPRPLHWDADPDSSGGQISVLGMDEGVWRFQISSA